MLRMFGIVMLWLLCALFLMRCAFYTLNDCFGAPWVEAISVCAGLLFLLCSLIGYYIMEEK